MGIFSIIKNLRRDKESAPVEPAPTVSAEEEKEDELPPINVNFTVNITTSVSSEPCVELLGLENAKKNAYGNYLVNYTPSFTYTIHGVNAKTARKNKRTYVVKNEKEAFEKAMQDGLVAPFEIVSILEVELPAPTERQLEYAHDVGIKLPNGACRADISALLTRYEEYDTEPAQQEHLDYLAVHKWDGSSLIGKNSAFMAIFRAGEIRDRVAIYAYNVHQTEHKLEVLNLNTDPRKHEYYRFADYVIQNQQILNHFEKWYMNGCPSTQRTWGIYKAYRDFFGTNL